MDFFCWRRDFDGEQNVRIACVEYNVRIPVFVDLPLAVSRRLIPTFIPSSFFCPLFNQVNSYRVRSIGRRLSDVYRCWYDLSDDELSSDNERNSNGDSIR